MEKTLESPLDYKEIKTVNPEGNQSWVFIGRTDVEAEVPMLWPPDENWLIEKDPDAGKDWRQEEKGMTEDEMVGWHHQLNGLEFEQAPGIGDGQGSLVCWSPWGSKESDMTEQLNWTELNIHSQIYVSSLKLPELQGIMSVSSTCSLRHLILDISHLICSKLSSWYSPQTGSFYGTISVNRISSQLIQFYPSSFLDPPTKMHSH